MAKRNKHDRRLDIFTTIIGLGMPIVSIPQLITVLTAPDVHSVSLVTWAYFTFQAAVFAVFSVVRKQTPLAITYIPLFFIQLGIVVTILVRSA